MIEGSLRGIPPNDTKKGLPKDLRLQRQRSPRSTNIFRIETLSADQRWRKDRLKIFGFRKEGNELSDKQDNKNLLGLLLDKFKLIIYGD